MVQNKSIKIGLIQHIDSQKSYDHFNTEKALNKLQCPFIIKIPKEIRNRKNIPLKIIKSICSKHIANITLNRGENASISSKIRIKIKVSTFSTLSTIF